MKDAIFQQLAGLLVTAKAGLRANTQLTGDGSGQYNYTPDEVCKSIYPHKMFEVAEGGVVPMLPLGKAAAPALAIYVDRAEFTDVEGSSGGKTYPVGMRCSLGLQYLFKPRAKDPTTMTFEALFSFNIWYVICQVLASDFVSDSSVLRDTYHINAMEVGSYSLLPPFNQALRAFEADLTIEFKRPPWMTGGDSGLVTDLVSIYGDLAETGESGADPLLQSIWKQ